MGERTGLMGLHPHTLGHTFATRRPQAAGAGADLVQVAALPGHEHMSTTARHTCPSAADPEAAPEKPERF